MITCHIADLAVEDDLLGLVDFHGGLGQLALWAEHPILNELVRLLLQSSYQAVERRLNQEVKKCQYVFRKKA